MPRFLRFLPDNVQCDAAFTEHRSGEGFFFPQNSEEQVLRVDVLAYEFCGFLRGKGQHVFARLAKREIDGSGIPFGGRVVRFDFTANPFGECG